MSKQVTNYVKSGKYEGRDIIVSSSLNYKSHVSIMGGSSITKEYVTKLEVLNRSSESGAIGGAIVAGALGAIIGASMADILVKIYWSDGNESIALVTSSMYNEMLVSITKTLEELKNPPVTPKEMTKGDKIALGCVVAIIVFIVLLHIYANSL